MKLQPEQVAYIGDDLPDYTVLKYVGLGIAPADACREVRSAAQYITQVPGGHGALRETVEAILQAQGRWELLIKKYSVI